MARLARRSVTLVVFAAFMLSGVPPLAAQTVDELENVLASRSTESWTGITVDAVRDVGTYLSVAIEPFTGAPFLSYYEGAAGDLWFAQYVGSGGNCGPGSSWHCQLVASTGDVGKYNSIAVHRSAAGEVSAIISFYDATNHALKIAQAACTNACPFVVSTIQSGTVVTPRGLHTAVAYAPTGAPWISYQTRYLSGNETVRVASYVGAGGNCGVGGETGRWQCDSILSSEGIGDYTAIDFDSSGRPHIAFYDPVTGYPHYAVRIGSGGNCGPANAWLCRSSYLNSHDTGRSISVFVEPDATPHLAYVDVTSEALIYATYVGSGGNCGWSGVSLAFAYQCDVIDDEIGLVGSGRTVAIAGDVNNVPIIAYRDASSDLGAAMLMMAQPYFAAPAGAVPNCGPVDLFYTWVCTVLDNGGAYQDEAAAVAMHSNASGVAIAYHELDDYAYPSEGNLKVSWNQLLIFADGFESASASRWSAHVP